jgi:esterase/lipase superfamily enzyme
MALPHLKSIEDLFLELRIAAAAGEAREVRRLAEKIAELLAALNRHLLRLELLEIADPFGDERAMGDPIVIPPGKLNGSHLDGYSTGDRSLDGPGELLGLPADDGIRSASTSRTSESPPSDRHYPVYFGTNRKPAADGTGFTNERHAETTRGRVLVHVPEAHRFGETGSSFWTRLWRLDLRSDRLEVQRVDPLDRDAFFAEIEGRMDAARATGEKPHALFFLHGYNCGFEAAAIRAAQIGYDLKVTGATAFFSWPSRGNVPSYTFDEATIEGSEKAITDFLIDFVKSCGADKVHVIAHSMGNRGLLRALQRIAGNAETRGKIRFGQIFLAAPDVDRDLFLDLAGLYPEHSDRTTLYSSSRDLPVFLSSHLHDSPRAGYFLPYTVAEGIDTVAVPNFNVDLLGHSYFAQAEALLHDIFDLMRHGQPPQERQRLSKTRDGETRFWKLQR